MRISSFKRYLPVEGGQTPFYQFWCTMKVKWKCVWKVLKPKIIAALIVIVSALVFVGMAILIIEYLIYATPPTDFTNMSAIQQQQMISVGTVSCISPMVIIAPIMIIGGLIGIIGLSIEYLKALAEALKPCIIWKEE